MGISSRSVKSQGGPSSSVRRPHNSQLSNSSVNTASDNCRGGLENSRAETPHSNAPNATLATEEEREGRCNSMGGSGSGSHEPEPSEQGSRQGDFIVKGVPQQRHKPEPEIVAV